MGRAGRGARPVGQARAVGQPSPVGQAGLLEAQVAVAAGVAHEVPRAAAHAAVAAVAGPADAEQPPAVVAHPAGVSPAARVRYSHVIRHWRRKIEAAEFALRLAIQDPSGHADRSPVFFLAISFSVFLRILRNTIRNVSLFPSLRHFLFSIVDH